MKRNRHRCLEVKGTLYDVRAANLLAIGFSSYGDYLQSELWALIRQRILDRDQALCIGCDKKATAVHHLTYGKLVLSGHQDDQLVSICGGCHRAIEFHFGDKVCNAFATVRKLLRRILRTKGHEAYQSAKIALWPRCAECNAKARQLDTRNLCQRCQNEHNRTASRLQPKERPVISSVGNHGVENKRRRRGKIAPQTHRRSIPA